jgi:penicillin-binding protein 1A
VSPPVRGGGRGPARRAAVDSFESHRRRRARLKGRGKRGRRRGAAAALALVLAVGAAVSAASVGGAVAYSSHCDLSALQPVRIGQNSFVYASNGSLLGSIPAERNRQPVTLEQTSPWLRKATVAIEDRRFYEHGGVDVEGIVRAAWTDLQEGRAAQGGSTITMQLVRNLYIAKPEKTLERKVKEACLAIKLNRAWSKDRILAGYMNQVYYGSLAYGVEAAAQTFFSKRARALNLKEAAVIAGLPQAPSDYNPLQRPDTALRRRDEVLAAMLKNGAITADQYASAVSDRKLHLRPGRLYRRIREPYAFSYVRDQLIAEYGATTVRSGGLRVYTTIDPRFQRLAERAVRDTLYYKDDPAAAVVSINPANGAIRAMTAVIPGRRGNQFNLAAQARRQAGSTFKTFVLAAAVGQGVDPESTYYTSAPFRYDPTGEGDCEDGSAWCVQTYGHSYLGSTSISRATLSSDNTVYAQLTLDLGPERVAAMAHKLGVQSSLKTREGAYVPSLGLGAMGVSPLEMASAYATLAAGGVYSRPTAIRKVILASGKEDTDAGWGKAKRKRVLERWQAWAVTKVLEQNIQGGTGVAAYFGRPSAGKTGTTEQWADAWFCGYTPNLSTVVWVGYPQGEIPMKSVHGISVTGGSFPAEIWRRFMEPALAPTSVAEWNVPYDQTPEWHTFEHGQYAHSYTYDPDSDTSYDSSAPSDDTPAVDTSPAPEKPAPAAKPAPTKPTPKPQPTPAPAPTPPPVTTAPPVEPTPPPPPTTTTAPPPPPDPGTPPAIP